jgi:uncharacterized protein YfdQ (DUF2303 family)
VSSIREFIPGVATSGKTENDSIIEFAQNNVAVEIFREEDPNGANLATRFAGVPKGVELKSIKPFLDEYREAPERRVGTAALTTEQSFVDHVRRYSGADTVLFARRDEKAPSVLAVYDYHPEGDNQRRAGFGDFRAVYEFPLSEEWQEWIGRDGKAMSPTEFAAFLEDRLPDVYAVDIDEDLELMDFATSLGGTYASPTKLLELSRSLEINAAVNVRHAIRLASGEINVAFAEVHNDGEGKPIRVPSLFVIGIPTFVDGIRYRMVCRLRYRLQGPTLTWWYQIVNPQRYLDDAVKDAAERIRKETERTLFYGSHSGIIRTK